MNFYQEFLKVKKDFVNMKPIPGAEDEYLMRASTMDELSSEAEVLLEENNMESSEEMRNILNEAKELL